MLLSLCCCVKEVNEYTRAVCGRCALYQLFVCCQTCFCKLHLTLLLLRLSRRCSFFFCFGNSVPAWAVPDGNEGFLYICENVNRIGLLTEAIKKDSIITLLSQRKVKLVHVDNSLSGQFKMLGSITLWQRVKTIAKISYNYLGI